MGTVLGNVTVRTVKHLADISPVAHSGALTIKRVAPIHAVTLISPGFLAFLLVQRSGGFGLVVGPAAGSCGISRRLPQWWSYGTELPDSAAAARWWNSRPPEKLLAGCSSYQLHTPEKLGNLPEGKCLRCLPAPQTLYTADITTTPQSTGGVTGAAVVDLPLS